MKNLRTFPQLACLTFGFLSMHCAAFAADEQESAYRKEVRATQVLRSSTTAIGQTITYPKTDKPEVVMLHVEIPPGKETGWHTHPVQGYAYVLSGHLTVEVDGGKQSQYEAGQGFAEVLNTLHNGKNLGTEPVKLVVVFTGEQGMPFTVKK